jgi:hypothetical protein
LLPSQLQSREGGIELEPRNVRLQCEHYLALRQRPCQSRLIPNVEGFRKTKDDSEKHEAVEDGCEFKGPSPA